MIKRIVCRIISKLRETKWKYKFSRSNVRIVGKCNIEKNVEIHNSIIFVDSTSELVIMEGVKIDGVGIYLTNGAKMTIGKYSILHRERNFYKPEYIVDAGIVSIADHVLLKMQRLWVRFGGVLTMNQYTQINFGSEVRCDNKVEIGSHCMISYNVRIWDTNTHCKMFPEKKHELDVRKYPNLGLEIERPKTLPVIIGNDCWLGEYSTILKGTVLKDNVNVGFRTLVSNMVIPKDYSVVQDLSVKMFQTSHN